MRRINDISTVLWQPAPDCIDNPGPAAVRADSVRLIIFRLDLEPALRLFADWADLGRLRAFIDVAAVEADPGDAFLFFENSPIL